MMLKYFALTLFIQVSWLTYCETQITATVTCTSCSAYVMTIGSTNYSMTCPIGTVCYTGSTTTTTTTTTTTAASASTTAASTTTAATTAVCSSNNPCDGVVCNRYATFPSSASCQQYHVCRYMAGYGTYVVTTLTCPGTSQFDQLTNKCTLSANVSCFNST